HRCLPERSPTTSAIAVRAPWVNATSAAVLHRRLPLACRSPSHHPRHNRSDARVVRGAPRSRHVVPSLLGGVLLPTHPQNLPTDRPGRADRPHRLSTPVHGLPDRPARRSCFFPWLP